MEETTAIYRGGAVQTKGGLMPQERGQELLVGMNEPIPSCHTQWSHHSAHTLVPPQHPSFSSNNQKRLLLLLLSATGWALGSSNTSRSSGVSLIKSWGWAGVCWGGGVNNSSFLSKKPTGSDVSVRHIPQSTAGASPVIELHSQWMRILPAADT